MLNTGRENREARTAEVISACDKGLEALKDIASIAKFPDLLQSREKLLDLRRAGEQVRLRLQAEKKFGDLNLRLTGVVARERHSQAIVNGKIVGKGEVVSLGDNNDVVVDEIRPDQVIFLFQGYRMALALTDKPRGR